MTLKVKLISVFAGSNLFNLWKHKLNKTDVELFRLKQNFN